MPFAKTLDNLALEKSQLVRRFEQLIAPKSDVDLEAMAQTSRAFTWQNFGRTMRLFAPLYLSNECINNCRYCGFSRDNPILRVTLSIEEVLLASRSPHLVPLIVASDMMRTGITPLQPDDWLDRALELFVESDLLALPVVDGEPERVVGIVKRADVSSTYLRHVQGETAPAAAPPAG